MIEVTQEVKKRGRKPFNEEQMKEAIEIRRNQNRERNARTYKEDEDAKQKMKERSKKYYEKVVAPKKMKSSPKMDNILFEYYMESCNTQVI